MDVTSAYSEKLRSYVRDYIFINTHREDIPAIIILKDQMTTSNPDFKKYWQVNTFRKPIIDGGKIILSNNRNKYKAKTHINFIYPNKEQIYINVLSGNDVFNIFGYQVTPPELDKDESNGHRIMVSPKTANAEDKFLTVFQMANDGIKPIQTPYQKVGKYDLIQLEDRLIYLRDGNEILSEQIDLNITDKSKEIFITGIQKGRWLLKNNKGQILQKLIVEENKNTLILELKTGNYILTFEG